MASRSQFTDFVAPVNWDVAVAFDRGLTVDGPFGFGDLLIDTAQGAPGPVMTALVVHDLIGDPARPPLRWPATVG